MLEPPAIDYALIEDCLRDAYGLTAPRAAFLPLGADVNTAVYRVESAEGVYFFKLRGGDFSPTAVLAPRFFSEQGIRQVIAPLRTRAGELWAALGAYTAVLAPFAAGQDGGVAASGRDNKNGIATGIGHINRLAVAADGQAPRGGEGGAFGQQG